MMVEMFWEKLNKKIINQNFERGFEYFSENMNDYSFVGEEIKTGRSITLTFKENKTGNLIELDVKVIK